MSFADGFAFVVDGVNYAKFQDGSVVSLQSLASNANLFNNTPQPSPYGIEYDGLTPALTITGLLNPTLSIHSFEVVVADTSDENLDSAVFLSGLKAGAGGDGGIASNVPEPATYALMLVGLAALVVARRRQLPARTRASSAPDSA